jgi:hypothetical protein
MFLIGILNGKQEQVEKALENGAKLDIKIVSVEVDFVAD